MSESPLYAEAIMYIDGKRLECSLANAGGNHKQLGERALVIFDNAVKLAREKLDEMKRIGQPRSFILECTVCGQRRRDD